MTFLGSGNMATNLAMAFFGRGVAIRCIYSPNPEHARALADRVGAAAVSTLSEVPSDDDCYIYAMRDAALADVVRAIHAPEALHIHTAGSVGIEVFDGLCPHAAVLYPFQTLSKDRLVSFDHLPLFLEAAHQEDYPRLAELAGRISDAVYEATSETRRRLHLAGVFANNFSNCMYAIAGEILRPTGLPESVLLSLIDETAAKVHTMPARQAQTGPAKRFDENVMARHMEMLDSDNQRAIYRAVSENIHTN